MLKFISNSKLVNLQKIVKDIKIFQKGKSANTALHCCPLSVVVCSSVFRSSTSFLSECLSKQQNKVKNISCQLSTESIEPMIDQELVFSYRIDFSNLKILLDNGWVMVVSRTGELQLEIILKSEWILEMQNRSRQND